jgi:hypothetical protein
MMEASPKDRHRLNLRVAVLLATIGWGASSVSAQDVAETVDYASKVKPLLRARCYACHGALKQEADLRLDTTASILQGGSSGPAVKASDPATSLLLARVSESDPAQRMPPEHEGEALSAEQIAILRQWIAEGAAGEANEKPEEDPRNHWAFQTVQRPDVPAVHNQGWLRNPIDAFVAQRHEQFELTPAGEAPRAILLRRLSLDLIGLPPTPAEIAAFQNDQTVGWYERAVDRLLDDPRHGERWARHWMDIWRYSDWWGLGDQPRNSQKHIWHWRDWIVESLNQDTSYDEMVRLMLAADETHPNDLNRLRASGYLARNYFLFNRNQWMDETVEHVSKGFLGLTMNCAKCHDHKYDPFNHADYYRMRAFFEPYHMRVDIVPGEADLARDGIPRAFDGLPDLPTYRFIRGQESNPDKSAVIAPGVPKILEFAPLAIESIPLPADAWRPDQRAWVVTAHLAAARKKVESSEATVAEARAKLQKAEQGDAATSAQRDLTIAELALAATKAEQISVEKRVVATLELAKPAESTSPENRTAASHAATQAEREFAVARATWQVADTELKLQRAADDKKEAATKDVATAKESLEKATKSLQEPSAEFTRLVGAQWTPTRFFNSTADDPTVTFQPSSTGRRKALANWITDRRNPLTARVAVNHIWMRHTGSPLVPTVFDFGNNGTRPANRELLDWLAAEFMDSGWSMKHLHRLIVRSATYRMASSFPSEATTIEETNLARDPDNRHFWRRTPVRLESQAVRDAILSLAGTLDETRGGPPVEIGAQDDSRRRSLYFFHSNNERNLFLTTFDEAIVKECYRRDQSIVPQQALALINSKLVLDAAKPIAERLMKESPSDDASFIRQACLTILGEEPGDAERNAMIASMDAWKKLPEAADDAPGFARAQLVWVLLNHSDFVTIR